MMQLPNSALTCVWMVRQTGSTGSCICLLCWTVPWLSGSSHGTSVPAWTWRLGHTEHTGVLLPLISASDGPLSPRPLRQPQGLLPVLRPHPFLVPVSRWQQRRRWKPWKSRVSPSLWPRVSRGHLLQLPQPPPGRRWWGPLKAASGGPRWPPAVKKEAEVSGVW